MLLEKDGVTLDVSPDVYEELTDPLYEHRQHYSRATYAIGCRGPLCKLAEKHRGRKRNEARAEGAGRSYEPRPGQRDNDRDAELAPIIAWHLTERGAIRRTA
jgi:hypothetical protein